jgi:hypothetical protein
MGTPQNINFDLIAPLHGQYFSIKFEEGVNQIIGIIDSKTFEIVERVTLPNFEILDIWKDRLRAFDFSKGPYEHRFFEKKIGDSQWNDLGLFQGIFSARVKYIYNGTIIVTGSLRKMPEAKVFWLKIEDDKTSDLVFEGLTFKPSWNTPIIANKGGELSEFRRALDLDSKTCIEAYNLSTQQVILATKKYTDIVDYAISPNGDSIALMTKKKIELYKVTTSGSGK